MTALPSSLKTGLNGLLRTLRSSPAGCIAVPLDAQLGPEEVKTLLLDAGAEIVLHSNKTADQLAGFQEQFRKSSGRDPLLIDFDSSRIPGNRKRAANRIPADMRSG